MASKQRLTNKHKLCYNKLSLPLSSPNNQRCGRRTSESTVMAITEGDFIVLLVLLANIILILVLILMQLIRNRKSTQVQLSINLTNQIQRLEAAAQHHADVSAVVTMIQQLDELDEDVLELIKSYPETVRAAAWLHYVNVLGSDLQAAQLALSKVHRDHSDPNGPTIKAAQTKVDAIRVKLDKAIAASGQSGLHIV